MKKIISLLLAMLMLFALFACNGQTNDDVTKLQQEIADLERQLNEQTELYEQMTDMLNEQIENGEQLDESLKQLIEQLQAEREQLQAEKDLLEQKLELHGDLDIVYTEDAPIYTYDYATMATVKEFDAAYHFDEFLQYYAEEISPLDYDFYFFYVPLVEDVWNENKIELLEQDMGDGEKRYYIKQDFSIFDEVLGGRWTDKSIDPEGQYPSFYCQIIFPMVQMSNIEKNGARFVQFGILSYDYRYINVYIGDTCIATCIYKPLTYISYRWFSGFFNNNKDAKLYYGTQESSQ